MVYSKVNRKMKDLVTGAIGGSVVPEKSYYSSAPCSHLPHFSVAGSGLKKPSMPGAGEGGQEVEGVD